MNRAELEKRAAILGLTGKDPAQALRMRIYRETKRRQAKPDTPAFDTFGMTLTPKFAEEVATLRNRIERICRLVAATRMLAERLCRSKLPGPRAQLETIVGAILSLEDRLLAAMPRALCPYCKGLDALQDDCRGCSGAGMVSVAQYNQAPKRLKEEPVVICEGRERPLTDFAADPKRGPFG